MIEMIPIEYLADPSIQDKKLLPVATKHDDNLRGPIIQYL